MQPALADASSPAAAARPEGHARVRFCYATVGKYWIWNIALCRRNDFWFVEFGSRSHIGKFGRGDDI